MGRGLVLGSYNLVSAEAATTWKAQYSRKHNYASLKMALIAKCPREMGLKGVIPHNGVHGGNNFTWDSGRRS